MPHGGPPLHCVVSMRAPALVMSALLGVACRGPSDPAAEPVCPSARPAAIVVESTVDKPTVQALLQREVEWRGARHPLALHPDGRLQVGRLEGRAEIPARVANEAAGQAWLRVISLGDDEHAEAILLSLPEGEGAQTPSRYQLFVAEGAELRRVFNGTLGTDATTELRSVGRGRMQYVEDGETACRRLGQPKEATRQAVTLGLDEAGQLVETVRVDASMSHPCDLHAG